MHLMLSLTPRCWMLDAVGRAAHHRCDPRVGFRGSSSSIGWIFVTARHLRHRTRWNGIAQCHLNNLTQLVSMPTDAAARSIISRPIVVNQVGDIESMPFVEAMRQFQFKVGRDNFCLIHVSLVPVIGALKEQLSRSLSPTTTRRSRRATKATANDISTETRVSTLESCKQERSESSRPSRRK